MLENPYWESINHLVEYDKIPLKYRYLRDNYCQPYAYTVSSPDVVGFLECQFSGRQVVEIGAGNGYYAWLLRQMGIDILAYDIAPPSETYMLVGFGRPETLLYVRECTLFLSWPPYKSDMALQCLQNYTGSRLVYIGEDYGGCCANNAFFERLENDWKEIDSYLPISWEGLHDRIVVYKRNK